MRRAKRLILVSTMMVAIGGCARPAATDPPSRMTPAPAAIPTPISSPPGGVDPKSVEAATEVVRRFAALLEVRDFKAAHRLWSGAGNRSGLNEEQFVSAYQKYARIEADVGAAGDSEGGAGSIYVEVPLRIHGTTTAAAPFDLAGPVTLRRVNDVDGATPAQLRWHIVQVALTPRG
jgi:hypothetical protein